MCRSRCQGSNRVVTLRIVGKTRESRGPGYHSSFNTLPTQTLTLHNERGRSGGEVAQDVRPDVDVA